MVRVQHFDASGFERTVQQVGERVQAYRESVPRVPGREPREIVKESLKTWAEEVQSPPTPAGLPPTTGGAASYLPAYLANDDAPAAQAVSALVGIAFQGHIEAALHRAKRMSPFVEDAFHDALVDRVLPEMRKRGLV